MQQCNQPPPLCRLTRRISPNPKRTQPGALPSGWWRELTRETANDRSRTGPVSTFADCAPHNLTPDSMMTRWNTVYTDRLSIKRGAFIIENLNGTAPALTPGTTGDVVLDAHHYDITLTYEQALALKDHVRVHP